MKAYPIGEDVQENRNSLKQFLRDHADQFNMNSWIEGFGLLEAAEAAESQKERLELFEHCGTTCCIGGAMGVLTSASFFGTIQQRIRFGFGGSAIFYEGEWPSEFRSEYREARDNNNYPGMVEAAIRAIDYFATKE